MTLVTLRHDLSRSRWTKYVNYWLTWIWRKNQTMFCHTANGIVRVDRDNWGSPRLSFHMIFNGHAYHRTYQYNRPMFKRGHGENTYCQTLAQRFSRDVVSNFTIIEEIKVRGTC